MKPEDLDDRAPVEPDDELLASIHSRSRSFRRHRSTQRLTGVTAGLLVVALAGGIAWTRVDTTDNRRITLPAATSTTTGAMPISQTTVMGKWRPISIAGYHGQLTTPSISFDGRGSWSGFDGCNDYTGGTYSLHGDELLLGGTASVTQKGCVRYHSTDSDPINPDFGPIVAAARIELRDDELAFLTNNGNEIARFVRAGVTARIELPSTTMTAGSKMTGHVVVENNTGHEIPASGCGSLFAVMLGNDAIHAEPVWPLCAQPLPIPVGESRYAVTIWASYEGCSTAAQGTLPACIRGVGPPSLPPGDYQARFFQSSRVVTPALPIDVKVEP